MLPTPLALAARVATLLPPAADRGLAAAVGPAWCALDRERRQAVAANRRALATGFPLSAPFSAYTASLFTWLRLLAADQAWVRERTTFEGLEGPAGLRAAAAPRGAVLVAAHVGSWEWGAAALAAAGLPVVAVAATQMNASWTPALTAAKARLGIEVVGPGASPHRLARALRGGAVVALLVDGDVATARAPGAMGTATALLPRGPARLAARTGAALWAGRCEPVVDGDGGGRGRGRGAHHVRLTALDAGRAGDEPRLHAAVAAWLDRTVREAPGAWCLFRPFFAASAPAGPAS